MNKGSFILNFEENDSDNLLRLEIDENKLWKIFPNIYKVFKKKKLDFKFIKEKEEGISTDLDLVQELISEIKADERNEIDKIYLEKPSIVINLDSQKKQIITNLSIINFHGTTSDGHFASKVNDFYLLVHISTAASQASSLGIWDIRINNWCFTHSDEGFYPISFKYHDNDDTFSITSSCYYYNKGQIEEEYVITKDKKLKFIKEN